MYYVKHNKRAGQRRSRINAALMISAAFAAVLVILNIQLRRIIEDSAQVHAQNSFSTAVSEAVYDVLGDNSFDLVSINTAETGQITAIMTDTAQTMPSTSVDTLI